MTKHWPTTAGNLCPTAKPWHCFASYEGQTFYIGSAWKSEKISDVARRYARELPDEVDLVFFNPNPETRVDGTIDDLRALLEKRKAS